jgi:hypothetical protein
MILDSDRPKFFDRIFVSCSFEPTIHPDGRRWDGLL